MKRIFTAALVALLFPGLALADVKISGSLQAETGTIDVDRDDGSEKTSTTVMGAPSGAGAGPINGGSGAGYTISGSEKLGNGLDAYFKIGTYTSTFNQWVGAGNRLIGIRSSDGWHVQFGSFNSAYKGALNSNDPFNGTGLQARAIGATSALGNGDAEDLAQIGFKSGGLKGVFQVTWEDAAGAKKSTNKDGVTDSGSWSGSLMYGTKAFQVGVAHISNSFDDVDVAAKPAVAADGPEVTLANGFVIPAANHAGGANIALTADTDVLASSVTGGNAANADGAGAVTITDVTEVVIPEGTVIPAASHAGADPFEITEDLTVQPAGFTGIDNVQKASTPPQAAVAADDKKGDGKATVLFGKWMGVPNWTFMAAFENVTSDKTVAKNGFRAFDTRLGGGAQFGARSLVGSIPSSSEVFKSQLLSAKYKISGSTTLMARFSKTQSEDLAGMDNYDADGSHWALGVAHNLSKRTSAYGGFMNSKLSVEQPGKADRDPTADAWVIGLKHKF